MEQDISNKTIVVLVILTVIISVLGTVVVLNEVSNSKIVVPGESATISRGTTAQAQVELTILPKPGEAPEPQIDTATGKVTLSIE